MKMLSVKAGGPLIGTPGHADVPGLPGDKSISHRAALFAALAKGESVFEHFLDAGVTRAMLFALKDLGVNWQLDGGRLTVQGAGMDQWTSPARPLDCGNSATTMRLLTGALSAVGLSVVLDGNPGLRRRPMNRIVVPLQQMGVPIAASGQGTAPLILQSRGKDSLLSGGVFHLQQASAQVKTCLLLAGLAAQDVLEIHEPARSRDHSERMLRAMGVKIETDGLVVRMQPPDQALLPLHMHLPGDFSAAAFLLVAALIVPGSNVLIQGVGLNPGRVGLLEALIEMGADITVRNLSEQAGEPVGDLEVHASGLRGIVIQKDQVVRMIDEFPIFAVAAAFADGETHVQDAEELRHKESDRIRDLVVQLQRIGVDITEHPDGFTITAGKPPQGGQVDSCGDHRLAMSLAVAGLACKQPVEITNADIIAESFPQFVDLFTALGGEMLWL